MTGGLFSPYSNLVFFIRIRFEKPRILVVLMAHLHYATTKEELGVKPLSFSPL
jgi:hypothetical protein